MLLFLFRFTVDSIRSVLLRMMLILRGGSGSLLRHHQFHHRCCDHEGVPQREALALFVLGQTAAPGALHLVEDERERRQQRRRSRR